MLHISTRGFTIVELLVVMAVSGVLLGLLFGPLDSLYQSNTKAIKQIGQIADIRGALHQISSEVMDSTGFYSSTSSPPADLPTISSPLGMNNSGTAWTWTGADANHRVLITSSYATTAPTNSDATGSRSLVYSPSANCTTGTTPLKNFFVYFVSGTTLYRRTIQNTSTPTFATNSAGTCGSATIAQKQSCAIANMSDSKCKAVDVALLSNVASFTVDYYQDANTTPISGEYNAGSTAPSTAKSIAITLATSTASGAQTSSIRVSPENG